MRITIIATTLHLLWGIYAASHAGSDTLRVFAAASTTNAVTEIGHLFSKHHHALFIPSFASSSTLAKQIENGAPADVYISANEKWMDYLQAKQMIVEETRIDLLSNRIVLIVPAKSSVPELEIGPDLDLLPLIGNSRLSMGDPDHVPAGIYGKQALENLELWAGVKNYVARTKDVRAALTLVERGEAPVGLVYATDAVITEKVKIAGIFPKTSHSPIVYPVAVITGKRSPATEQFMALIQSLEARAVFRKFGFSVR